MFGVSPFRRNRRHHEEVEWRLDGTRWREGEHLVSPGLDQEQEVRAKLYGKPPATERTVEVLGPVEHVADQAA
jgi:hypothetical protein